MAVRSKSDPAGTKQFLLIIIGGHWSTVCRNPKGQNITKKAQMALSTDSGRQQNSCGEIEEVDGNDIPQFDVVSDDFDHHFLHINKPDRKNPDCFDNISSGVHKKIMQEWRILEKHLPASIFVRVYERRIDLLRAAIIGAAGTPYHDGLFFFDFAFPPDYPARPPLVHYHSFGLRINPNLYANGRLCLSLINTWSGRKSEKWNPEESTVLQVLVSIQGLVLNEKPYYNEPGYGSWPLMEKRSSAYNETVFLLSCKTMLFLLSRPPKNLEGFVARHVRERAVSILSACKAYASGRVRIGYYYEHRYDVDAAGISYGSSSKSSAAGASEKFKGLMDQLYPRLVVAFSKAGAPVGHFVKQLNMEKKTAETKKKVSVRKKRGFAMTILEKVKKVLGFKSGGSGKSNAKKKAS